MMLFAIALIPVVVIILYVVSKDRYEKEPFKYLAISFILGGLSIIPAIFAELKLQYIFPASESFLLTALNAFIAVALVEEFVKYMILRYYVFKKEEFNEPIDGIIYGVMIGMGFAAVENIFYVLDGGIGVGVLRMFTAVPGHAVFGIAMGYFVGLAKFDPEHRTKLLLKGFLLAWLLHGFYDFFLFQQNFALMGLLSFVGLFFALRFSRKAIAQQEEISPYKNQVDLLRVDIQEPITSVDENQAASANAEEVEPDIKS